MSAPPPTGPPPFSGTRFAPYRQALYAISARTGTALPSLVFSFAVLHELTAIVPTVGLFFGARALGVGERVVQAIAAETEGEQGWAKGKAREWLDEGGQWAERVGRRYGVFGYEKRERGKVGEQDTGEEPRDSKVATRLAGDTANAILAYGLTKVRSQLLCLHDRDDDGKS